MKGEPCRSYRAGFTCADGFVQKPFCSGTAGCFSCGHIKDKSLPHCLNEDIPSRWLKDGGLPAFRSPAMTKPIEQAQRVEQEVTPEMLEAFWCNLPSPYDIDMEDDEAAKNTIRAVFATTPDQSKLVELLKEARTLAEAFENCRIVRRPDGTTGDFGWNITELNKVRIHNRAFLSRIDTALGDQS